MARDLGLKHHCFQCGTKFYDLGKPVPICPKCGADAREQPATASVPFAEKHRPATEEAPEGSEELEAEVEEVPEEEAPEDEVEEEL